MSNTGTDQTTTYVGDYFVEFASNGFFSYVEI